MINHYGVFVDKNEPTTGVYNSNQINWEFIDLDYICLDCESILQDNPELDHDDLYCEGHTHLYGSWKIDENGLYEPDKTGDYSFIYNSNMNTIQVAWSETTIKGGLCSPCYPGQVDVGSQGDFTAYAFPDDMIYKE